LQIDTNLEPEIYLFNMFFHRFHETSEVLLAVEFVDIEVADNCTWYQSISNSFSVAEDV
jgi:hypothetical protein